MKMLLILSLAVLVAAAPPPLISNTQANVSLLKSNSKNDGLGRYKYSFQLSEGTRQEQEGELINEGTDDEYLFVKGSFSWIAPDGVTYTIKYIADKEGHQTDIGDGPGSAYPLELVNSMVG